MSRRNSLSLVVVVSVAFGLVGTAFGQAASTSPKRVNAFKIAQRGGTPAVDPAVAAKEHAQAIRSHLQSARRSYSVISDAAKQNAEITQKLAEIAAREEQLLAEAKRLETPVVLPVPRRQSVAYSWYESPASVRIPQTYYFTGEGHFID